MQVLRFRILGLPVQILPGFWLLLLILSLLVGGVSLGHVVLLSAVAFVSLLAHELGHALAARRAGFAPTITLHLTGGLTTYPNLKGKGRLGDALISLAGPGAGLLLASLAYAVLLFATAEALPGRDFAPAPPEALPAAPAPGTWFVALIWMVELNVFWSVLNLVPIVPFDGGRVLLAALGQKPKLAASVSLGGGMAVALAFVSLGQALPAIVFGMAAVASFLRIQRLDATPEAPSGAALEEALQAAERALQQGTFREARWLAERVLLSASEPALRRRAAHTVVWGLLGEGNPTGASAVVASLDAASLDPYVVAAVWHATGELERARAALEAARAQGDQRLEVSTLLVRVCFDLGQLARAAELALTLGQHVPAGELRHIADRAEAEGALLEAGQLRLALARSNRSFSDARAALLLFRRVPSQEDERLAWAIARELDPEAASALGAPTESPPDPPG